MPPRVVYFAQDLADAAVARRVRMLRTGGAHVTLIGFHRTPAKVYIVEEVIASDLGQTKDGKLAARFGLVLRRAVQAGRWADKIMQADVLLARNLEMITIADAAKRKAHSTAPLVYECLDIHSSLLGNSIPSKLLRLWETRMLARSAALIVSSQGFVKNYFDTLKTDLPPIIVVENKRILPEGVVDDRPSVHPEQISAPPPWRIGWFGNIRCVHSFRTLRNLAEQYPDLVDIEMRGRPHHLVQNLIDQHGMPENMRFGGAYDQSELAAMYRKIHFTWAVDYFQRGQNSDWLLPNRLYEGGYYNRPAIALRGTETAHWLHTRGAGVLVQDDIELWLENFFTSLTISHYRDLEAATAAIPLSDLIHTADDCRCFTTQLTSSRQIDNKS